MSETKDNKEAWKRLFENIYETFKRRSKPYISEIVFVAVLSLIVNNKVRFTLNDIYEEVLDILSKLKTKPVEISRLSLRTPVGFWLVGIGFLEKISEKPTKYIPAFELTEENLKVINKYYGRFMQILFKKYGKAE